MPRAASSRPDSELLDKNRPTGTHFSALRLPQTIQSEFKGYLVIYISSQCLFPFQLWSALWTTKSASRSPSFFYPSSKVSQAFPFIQPMRHFVIFYIVVSLEILDVLIPHQLSTLFKALKPLNLRFLIFSPAGTLNLRISTMSAQKITVARCAQLYLVGHLN